MKKSLFFVAAASALMLTACSSESDVLQTATQPQATVKQQAVGFDVYTPSVTDVTRAGYAGVMNTTRLQGVANGFGLYGFYSDQTTDAQNTAGDGYPELNTGYVPNFMWNQQVTWDDTSKGWTYNPLKYWPNETVNDSQTNPDHAYMNSTTAARLDRLTFFAYAPYVADGAGTDGITAITAKNGTLTPYGGSARAATDPLVEYVTAGSGTNAVQNGVDLLWGVAPAGGLQYTAVNGETNTTLEGKPYIDMTKPDVNTSLKFFFQHALARFGFTVAAAIDQVPQGGVSGLLDPAKTTVTVEKVTLKGYFGTRGILNLNNNDHANVANWISMNSTDLATGSTLDAAPLQLRTLTITDDLNPNIKDDGAGEQTVTVTTAKQELVKARHSQVDDPTTFVAGDKYYTNAGVELYADITGEYYTKNDAGSYIKVIDSRDYPTTYYTVTSPTLLAADPAAAANIYRKVSNDYIFVATFDGSAATGLDYSTNDLYTITAASTDAVTAASFTWDASKDYYKPERSYYMVVPTNNVENICTTNFANIPANKANREALRKVWVEITYYVTTDDDNLNAGFSRVKNVITKEVVLPSLENGKSYNIHLLLGLTSVKVEAEVGDWKEVYVQTDLPQNTAE